MQEKKNKRKRGGQGEFCRISYQKSGDYTIIFSDEALPELSSEEIIPEEKI